MQIMVPSSIGNKDGAVIAVFSVDRCAWPFLSLFSTQMANRSRRSSSRSRKAPPDDLFVSSPLLNLLGVVVGLSLLLVGLGIGGEM